jgi:glycosyltransferase involved in cell wall biosynthesis
VKVVIAHNRYVSAQPSGENTIVESEITQLTEAGVTVIPFIRNSDDIPGLPVLAKAALPVSPIYNRSAQRALASLLATERPDVLHLHNPYPLLSPWVVRTAHRHGVPVVQTVHNYRQVCSSGLFFRDGHVCHDCAGRGFGLPAVQHACYRGSRAQSAIMAATLAIHRGTWHTVDRYLALTSAIADHLRGYGIPSNRISVKPNGIPDPGRPEPPGGTDFLFAARLTQEKGLGLLLDAWSRHPAGSLGLLRVAGDGPLRSLAETAARERTDVEYLGPLSPERMRAAIRAAGCVVVPSTWHDVLPTIALEALANGRPVLGTRLGGLPYLVGADPGSDGPSGGWIVDPDPEALSEGLALARKGAAESSGPARRRYELCFAPSILTARLIEIYEEVASS